MIDYINRDEFLEDKRHIYCDNCVRRKNSKGKVVYDIGDAPCRACEIEDVLNDVESFHIADVVGGALYRQAAWERDMALAQLNEIGKSLGSKMDDVKPVVHGKWLRTPTSWVYCSVCDSEPPNETNLTTKFCPNCGAEMENGE